MKKYTTEFKHVFLFGALALAVSSCSCSDKECKSSRDCKDGAVCRNGECVIDGFLFSTDSDSTPLGWDTSSATENVPDTFTAPDTSTESDTDTSTSTNEDTASTTDTGSSGAACSESWQCNDDNACTTESCQNGFCSTVQTTPVPEGCCTTNADCNDLNSCTADQCNLTTFECQNVIMAASNCCESDLNCDDGNGCTIDSCGIDGMCIHIADLSVPGCCDDVNDCGSSSCTILSCVNYQCAAAFPDTLPDGCCMIDDDCTPPAEACTVAICNARGECEFETNPSLADGCCMTDGDCDDGNNCNVDECTYEYQCVHHAPVTADLGSGCCLGDGDCADGNNCTVDVCVDNVCTTGVPSPMPDDCCGDNADCDDLNSCTRDVCSSGRCSSYGDPALGSDCCAAASDCDDSDACTQNSCDVFLSECVYLPPDTDSLPADCCLKNSDCTNPANLCEIGSCGPSPKYHCQYETAANDAPCDDNSYCNGPEVCSSGLCVTRSDDVPCGGPSTTCRVVGCDDVADNCTAVNYDTDVTCNDNIFCNGDDYCLAGDCVHRNPPCASLDTDSLGECEEYACIEADSACVPSDKPNFTSCDNSLACDGVNMCIGGVCESGDYCGGGNDCVSYVCAEGTIGDVPTCSPVYAANGVSCATPDLGACFGTTSRKCLNGVCSMGSDPICAVTPASDGFCKRNVCLETQGDPAGCYAFTIDLDTDVDTTDTSVVAGSFTALGCADPADTADTDFSNTLVFSSALQRNHVSDYGNCDSDSSFDGGDLIYQIELVSGKEYSFTIDNIETTYGGAYNAYVMLLENACDATSCAVINGDPTSATITHTAGYNGTHYIVIDAPTQEYIAGTLTVSCP